jgi:glycosyltransferase involved in cell wall biosynthesis
MARAARIVALWPQGADALRELYRVRQDKLRVIPNARSATEFQRPHRSNRAAARIELELDRTDLVVAVLGSLTPEKRVDLALRSLALVENARILVAGDGPERAALEHLVASLPDLRQRTKFLGPLTDVRQVLYASDSLLSTSSTEGLAGTFIEAGFTGLPLVSTDVGATRWMLEHGVFTGAVVPRDPSPSEVATAIRALPRDRAGATGAAICSWPPVVAQWHTVLSELSVADSDSTRMRRKNE